MTRIRRRKGQTKATRDKKRARSVELAEQHPAHPLGRRGVWKLNEDGTWTEGRAGPEKLPDGLDKLPGEIVTRDMSDGDRAHELDPPHVIEAFAYEFDKAEREAEKPKPPDPMSVSQGMSAPIGEVVPLTQGRIDAVRWRIAHKSILPMWLAQLERGEDVDIAEPMHVWFPSNNVNEYELRLGLAPRSEDRPKHLRHFRLRINPFDPPRSIRDLFEAADVPVPDAMRVIEQATNKLMQAAIEVMQ
jgi:hypothetical protein